MFTLWFFIKAIVFTVIGVGIFVISKRLSKRILLILVLVWSLSFYGFIVMTIMQNMVTPWWFGYAATIPLVGIGIAIISRDESF